MEGYKFLEFFAGGGLARLGLGDHWECHLANDWDEKKAACYVSNWEDDKLVVDDIKNITADQITEKTQLAWASFPCQDVSLAGAGAGLTGKRSGTFWPFWALIQKLHQVGYGPPLVVLENVCGMVTSNSGMDLDAICNALVDTGYRVGAIVVDASLFVPQSRPRLFVVGVLSGLHIPQELQSKTPRYFHSDALRRFVADRLTISPADWIWWNPKLPEAHPIPLESILETNTNAEVWDDHRKTCNLLKMMSSTTLKKIGHIRRSGNAKVGTVYKRMRKDKHGRKVQRAEARFDGLAGCLRAPTGGSSRQQVIMVNGNSIHTRLMSAKEALALMGVPSQFEVPANYNDAYRVAGEGVAVPVVRYLASQIIEPIISENK
jgi:DNA (cytosine-5)-methyltransferase 1